VAEAVAVIATPNGSKYLQQLCKHWSHKLETECDAVRGRVNFEVAAAHFAAAADALTVTVAASDATTRDRIADVVARHLQRFAFREPLGIQWVRG
jgi:hypothetical protein